MPCLRSERCHEAQLSTPQAQESADDAAAMTASAVRAADDIKRQQAALRQGKLPSPSAQAALAKARYLHNPPSTPEHSSIRKKNPISCGSQGESYEGIS